MQISPQLDDHHLAAFCSQICKDSEPISVPVIPDVNAAVLDCFANTARKVSQDGGQIVYGWEISMLPGLYLEAVHHAVWMSQGGDLVSVTPGENGQSQIVFLTDHSRTYNGTAETSLRYSLVPGVDEVLKAMDQLSSEMMPLILAGHRPGSQAFAPFTSRIAEIDRLRKSLGITD